MAPEILNYVPGINPKSSEYTNAVDIWALGCMVCRLANGVVPFPPGPSLLNFCRDESKFPPQSSALSELGANFVRDLVVPYPSRRITAQQALDHDWTKARPDGSETKNPPVPFDFKGSESGIAHPITKINRNGLDTVASFGGYNTVTHAGLQSYGPAASTRGQSPVHAESGRPKLSYHPPTVEYEKDGTNGAHEFEADIALDQRQMEPSSDPTPHAKADAHSVPDEVGEPRFTVTRSRRKLNSFRSTRPEVTTIKRKPAKRADPKPVSPELSDSSSDSSWNEINLNASNSPRPQARQAREPIRYIIDNDRGVPITARNLSGARDVENASGPRERSESPPPQGAREQTRYIIKNGRSLPVTTRYHTRRAELRDEGESSNASDHSESPRGTRSLTHYVVDNSRNVPVTARHRDELQDPNEASHTGARSVSPQILPTRYSRRQYSNPFSYVDDCGDPPTPLTPDNLNKLASKSEASDSPSGSADAQYASDPCASETEAILASTAINIFPTLSSDVVVKAASASRRVYFADEKGHVDHVPENSAGRHGNTLEAPEPPTPASKRKDKTVYGRSSWKFKPKRVMSEKRVLEWQEDVVPYLNNLHPERHYLEPEPIIHTARPKMLPRDGDFSPRVGDRRPVGHVPVYIERLGRGPSERERIPTNPFG
jgi:hypothetical protein